MNPSKVAQLILNVQDRAVAAVEKALEEGADPIALLQDGVTRGLELIGERFEAGEYFLPQLIMGGKIAGECITLIDSRLPEKKGAPVGVVVIGAVEGDLHDIGYGLVAQQLQLAGFEIHSLGVNIPAMSFIDKAREVDAQIIGLSAFLATTIPNCAEVIDYLRDMGLRKQFKVIIGGAQTSQEVADAMGADGWAPNAVAAVRLCQNLLGTTATRGLS
jgi:5-methyltetrahydrofolate--homocysteine methyltransferase